MQNVIISETFGIVLLPTTYPNMQVCRHEWKLPLDFKIRYFAIKVLLYKNFLLDAVFLQ